MTASQEILDRWPEHAAFRHGDAGYRGAERSECVIAREVLSRQATAARRGEQPARLAPDLSCLPPRQLCHLLPKTMCTPGSVGDRVLPETRAAPSHGRRSDLQQY